jgi:hypothetical protein
MSLHCLASNLFLFPWHKKHGTLHNVEQGTRGIKEPPVAQDSITLLGLILPRVISVYQPTLCEQFQRRSQFLKKTTTTGEHQS